jgi:hypothetical protein
MAWLLWVNTCHLLSYFKKNYNILLQIFIIEMKSHTKTYHNWLNLIRLCTTSSNWSTHHKPNNIFTSTRWSKFIVAFAFFGVLRAILISNVQYSFIIRFIKEDIWIYLVRPFSKILFQPLVSITYISFWNSRCHLRLWAKLHTIIAINFQPLNLG